MLFSEYYKIEPAIAENAEWFDPILDVDTKLFIDPFLIFKSHHAQFQGAHDQIMAFFEQAFLLAAESSSPTDARYKKLLSQLEFKEVSELCLGYSGSSTAGLGSGKGFARAIAEAIRHSIDAGIKDVRHFEETGLLNEGIGPDRISDATASIIKGRIILYTQNVCENLNIPMSQHKLKVYDPDYKRWHTSRFLLPTNPLNVGRPVLLVPKEFLRELPTINPGDFGDYIWDNYGETLRNDFGFEIKSDLKNKRNIIAVARRLRSWVEGYMDDVEQRKGVAYDLVCDPSGLYRWEHESKRFTSSNPMHLSAPNSRADFLALTAAIVDKFKLFVEHNGGYKLLWDGAKPKNEEAAQLLFLGIAKSYCEASNIDLSREVNLGSGPVDFKFSNGYTQRVLLEAKLVNNSKFWNGLERQLVKYQIAEETPFGIFLAIAFTEDQLKTTGKLATRATTVAKQFNTQLEVRVVDATLAKPSASKL